MAKIRAPHPKTLSGPEILPDFVMSRGPRKVTVWRPAQEDWHFISPDVYHGDRVQTVPRGSFLIIEEGEGTKTTYTYEEKKIIEGFLDSVDTRRSRR